MQSVIAEHVRSDLGVGLEDWNCVSVEHTVRFWHARSDVSVGSTPENSDGRQSRTLLQRATSGSCWNVIPRSHRRQLRSELVVGGSASSSPVRHVVKGKHGPSLTRSWKWLAAQTVQTRSAEGDDGEVSPVPGAQRLVFWQRARPPLSLNVPFSQGRHSRSLDAVGALDCSCPAGQMATNRHGAVSSSSGWKSPSPHGAHTRSEMIVAGCACSCATPHSLIGKHAAYAASTEEEAELFVP